MSRDQEANGIVERLVARFPSLPTERIRHVVGVERQRLSRGALREAAPPLVEEAAMDELRKDADPVRLRGTPGNTVPRPDPAHELDPLERSRRERAQHGAFQLPDLDGGLI